MMLLVGEVKAVVGLGMFMFFLGKIQKIWQKLYHLSDMFPCLGGGLVFLLCPVFEIWRPWLFRDRVLDLWCS